MELGLTDRLRRNEQLSRTTQAAAPEKAEATPLTKRQQARADQLELSKRALAMLEQQRKQTEVIHRQEKKEDEGGLLGELETANAQLEAFDKEMKTMQKCQKIAARIMAGDKVPPEDLRYLMEHDSNGYKLAMALRRPKEDPEEWESVLDDEDRNGGTSEGGDASAADAAPAPAADAGGGE